VLTYIGLGKDEGAKIVIGGGRPKGDQFNKGFWIEPTVFTGVDMAMRIAKEEIFGPVMSILKWKEIDEAVRMANAIDLGLTAAVWTRDLAKAINIAHAVQAGYVWVNSVGTHYRGVPYGGFKNSGTGREEGIEELMSYTEVKAINIALGDSTYNPG
jgi:acyl-CoA reductase-like NAD-dependent aldehyde dehydrogenase